jgi:hypothetical protein
MKEIDFFLGWVAFSQSPNHSFQEKEKEKIKYKK